jgi:hypothetical protein
MLNIFRKTKGGKISEAKKRYYKEHGNTRQVPVRHGNKTISYVYLAKRKGGVRYIGEGN